MKQQYIGTGTSEPGHQINHAPSFFLFIFLGRQNQILCMLHTSHACTLDPNGDRLHLEGRSSTWMMMSIVQHGPSNTACATDGCHLCAHLRQETCNMKTTIARVLCFANIFPAGSRSPLDLCTRHTSRVQHGLPPPPPPPPPNLFPCTRLQDADGSSRSLFCFCMHKSCSTHHRDVPFSLVTNRRPSCMLVIIIERLRSVE